VFEAVSRKQYWLGIGLLIAGLIVLSWWMGWYVVDDEGTVAEAQVHTNDPMMEILYSPLGNAVVLLVLQYAVANLLFWGGVWVWLRVRGGAD
jgi:hypothetical protein